jgi:hypothetical protein
MIDETKIINIFLDADFMTQRDKIETKLKAIGVTPLFFPTSEGFALRPIHSVKMEDGLYAQIDEIISETLLAYATGDEEDEDEN